MNRNAFRNPSKKTNINISHELIILHGLYNAFQLTWRSGSTKLSAY